ncbi:MAG: pyridoxamine 5'-phosphate oxidase family protein [Pirellulaceae bacterium]
MTDMQPSLITDEVAQSIELSVLCWLATVAEDGSPNVSPKEAFLHDGQGRILIAHIASPQSVRNIQHDPRVCLSFIDVFTQRGHKIRGEARLLTEDDARYENQKSLLAQLVGERFPIRGVIEVQPTAVEEIIAPSYRLFPNTTTRQMVAEARTTYRVAEYQEMGNDCKLPVQQ